jgi:hypothetical protein
MVSLFLVYGVYEVATGMMDFPTYHRHLLAICNTEQEARNWSGYGTVDDLTIEDYEIHRWDDNTFAENILNSPLFKR